MTRRKSKPKVPVTTEQIVSPVWDGTGMPPAVAVSVPKIPDTAPEDTTAEVETTITQPESLAAGSNEE